MNNLIPKKSSPVLLDAVIQDIQQALESIAWIDNVFGRAHRVEREGKFVPAAHSGFGEYTVLLPSDGMGNYSYIEINDPVEQTGAHGVDIKGTGSVIVWLDSTTHPSENGDGTLNYEEAKNDIIYGALKGGKLKKCRIFVRNTQDKPENIFKGYDIRQVAPNYLTYPWGGFKIEFEFLYTKTC